MRWRDFSRNTVLGATWYVLDIEGITIWYKGDNREEIWGEKWERVLGPKGIYLLNSQYFHFSFLILLQILHMSLNTPWHCPQIFVSPPSAQPPGSVVLSHLQSYGHCHGSGPSLGSSDLGLGIRRDWSKVEATYSPILVTTEAGLRVKHSWSPCLPAWPWAISLPLAPLGSHVVSEPDPPVGPVYLFSIIPITSFPAICPVIGSWFRDHQLSGKSEPQERLTQSLATMEVPEGLKWPVLVLRCSVLAVF